MPLDNQWVKGDIRQEIGNCPEANEHEDTHFQNVQDAAKAVPRGTFIATQGYFNTQEKSQINNLNLHLKELEKEEQTKPKVNRRRNS